MNEDNRWAVSELHYTDFGSSSTFTELTRRHRLKYTGESDCCSAHNHEWAGCFDGDHLVLRTKVDPRDEGGYASYLAVCGDMPFVESLYRDVVETAEHVKGEFQPLKAGGSGEAIASLGTGGD